MSLTLFALLLCTPPTHAQTGGYPGGGSGGSSGGYPGGSGYPGGGSGGGPAPDPGHYWKITYSSSGHVNYAIPDSPAQGQSTPQSFPWDPTSDGGGVEGSNYINCDVLSTVTATLTWVPAASKTLQSDPPSKMVSIEESGTAQESPGQWNGDEALAPTPAGSASDGLGDPPVAWNEGYISTGTHRVRKDGSSGTITLGPFTLTAICPVSTWMTDNTNFPYYHFSYWDWMGGLSAAGFSVAVVPPAKPVNFRCISASADSEGNLHYEYAWDSSTGNLADLDACTIKERLSYDGNSTGYYSKDVNGTPCYVLPPPFKGVFANPEIYGGTSGTQGGEGDDQFVPQIPGPYQYGSYTAIQDYIYTDDNSNPNNPNDYTVLRGPIDIVRTVWAPDINWVYDITKYDYPDALSGSYLSNRLILAPVYPQFGP
jgi:hypothetical protein